MAQEFSSWLDSKWFFVSIEIMSRVTGFDVTIPRSQCDDYVQVGRALKGISRVLPLVDMVVAHPP